MSTPIPLTPSCNECRLIVIEIELVLVVVVVVVVVDAGFSNQHAKKTSHTEHGTLLLTSYFHFHF